MNNAKCYQQKDRRRLPGQAWSKLMVLSVIVFLVIAQSLPAQAYTTIYNITWADSSLPVRVTLDHVEAAGTLSREEWRREIRAAMQIWNNAGTKFRFEESPASQAAVDIRMANLSDNYATTCFKNTPTGVCGRPNAPGGNFLFADIEVDRDANWVSRDSGAMGFLGAEPDPQTVIAHELGHVAGLDHTSEIVFEPDPVKHSALMYRWNTQVHRWLSDDDRAGLRRLYGNVVDQPQLPAPVGTNEAAFVTDVTIPDGMDVGPNQSLVKTWRVRNTGTATWTTDYELVLIGDNSLRAPQRVRLHRSVAPGQEIDLSVPVWSPATSGPFRSDWRLHSPSGQPFGDPLWIKIDVVSSSPPPTSSQQGIEIVSVSSHTVGPGQQFNPSVTVRATSGQFDPTRGDHLHATPENESNTFGAYPVQPVRTVVRMGETYTFDQINDSNFRITAPQQAGTYQSVWQLRVGGKYVGPQIIIRFTVSGSSGSSGWHSDYWMNQYLAGYVNYNTSESQFFLFKDWGSGGPGGGIPADDWSARFLRDVYFPGGTYRFHCQHDDGCRIYVGGQEKVNGWGGSGEHDWEGYLPAGTHEVRVEMYERTGGARLEAWWQGPGFLPFDQACDVNQWCAEYWGNRNFTGIPAMKVNEGDGFLAHSWGSGSPGYGMPTDNFTARWRRTVPFTCGQYRFNVHSDDAIRLFVGDRVVLDEWGSRGADFQRDVSIGSGNTPVRVEYLEVGGDASIQVRWTKLSTCDDVAPNGVLTLPIDESSTSNPLFTLQAEATDSGSGVQRVDFYAYYDNAWHSIGCSIASAPYTCTWDATAVPDQAIAFKIHVVDTAGNEGIATGGTRTIHLQRTPTARTRTIAVDGLVDGWENWSWNTTVDARATRPVYEGRISVGATFTAAYGGLYLHHPGTSLSGYTVLEFAIHGGASGGQRVQLLAKDTTGATLPTVNLSPYLANSSIAPNVWQVVRVPLADLGLSSASLTGLIWQDASGGSQPTIYLDAVQLSAGPTSQASISTAGLDQGWENWSWNTQVELTAQAPDTNGDEALRVNYTSPWAGLYLHHPGFDTTGLNTLEFVIHGGTVGGQLIQLHIKDGTGTSLAAVPLNQYLEGGTLTAQSWQRVRIPLRDLGPMNGTITGIVWQDAAGSSQPTWYLDSVRMLSP